MVASNVNQSSSLRRSPAHPVKPVGPAKTQSDEVSDAVLVQLFKAGDESAFLEIMARHHRRLHSVAEKILNNHADAEEITQDVFVRAYRGLASFRGDSSLATWLHRITMNLARNRYWYFFRRRRHNTVSLDSPCSPDSTETRFNLTASDALDPSDETANNEYDEWVKICFVQLEEPHQEILRLRNSLDLSYDEIARQLSIKIGTVKSRIARAREDLRALLSQTCPELMRK